MSENESIQPSNIDQENAMMDTVDNNKCEEEEKLEKEEKLEEEELKEEGKLEIEEKLGVEEKTIDQKEEKNESQVFEKTQPGCPIYQTYQSSEKTEKDTPESLAKRLLKGEDISILKPSDTIPVVNYLSAYRDEHLRNHDVKEGEHAENIICKIQDGRKNSIKGSIAEERAKELQQRIDEANQQLIELEQRVKNTMASLKNENQNNLDKLRQKHDQEIDVFISKWQSKKYTKQFSRASTALRSLRAQSILLMNQKRFDELRKTDQIASNLEKEETEAMARAMNQEYDKQFKLLTEKHQNEINVLKSTQQRRVASVKSAGGEAIDTLKKRIDQLQYNLSIAKDPIKYWNVYHRNESAVLSRAIKSTNQQEKKRDSKTLNMKMINTLKLPPLFDSRMRKTNKSKSQSSSPSK
ncbi:hypothetical protein M9Y10_017555 [Tritrichomonas musculus]|uniref:DUF4201 domain-containing protein n=1 Tax=Tritrichomonas musculus TaxID=1915356 RepID=A0ABR2HVJ4_9EUKA